MQLDIVGQTNSYLPSSYKHIGSYKHLLANSKARYAVNCKKDERLFKLCCLIYQGSTNFQSCSTLSVIQYCSPTLLLVVLYNFEALIKVRYYSGNKQVMTVFWRELVCWATMIKNKNFVKFSLCYIVYKRATHFDFNPLGADVHYLEKRIALPA